MRNQKVTRQQVFQQTMFMEDLINYENSIIQFCSKVVFNFSYLLYVLHVELLT